MTGKRNKAMQSLRKKAEAQLGYQAGDGEQIRSLTEKRKAELIHELQVHQVELEIQNEELRQAQTHILASHQRFADLFHRAPVGYLVLDHTGLIRDANDTFCQMIGRNPKSLKNRSFFDLVVENDRPWFIARYKALYKKPERKNIELALRTGEKQSIDVSLNAVLYEATAEKNEDGNLSLLLTVNDISERKRAEQALKAQTDLLATVFESSPNVLILVDGSGRVEKINRVGSELAGTPQEELIGKLGGEVLHCLNAYEGKGCGRNPECSRCPVRTRVTRSLLDGEIILNEEGRLKIWQSSQEIQFDFLVSTVPVEIDGAVKVLVTIVDDSERKRNDERIHYQAYLLENVSDAIVSADENFSILSWNRAAEEMYGWKEAEVLGNTIEDVLKPEFKQPLNQIMDNFYNQGTWEGEGVQYRKDGTPLMVFSSIRLVKDDDENLVRVIATYRDISDKKRAEDALRKSELQYRTILRTALDGFWIVDPDSARIVDVNDAYCQMSGYSREEILQMAIADLVAMESGEDVHHHSDKTLASGSDRFESVHRRKDGSTYQVEVSVRNLEDDGGRNFAFIHDVSARKQAEVALRKSEEQYRLLFDEMLGGLALHEIICDKDGKPVDYRFLAVNAAFEQLTGLEKDDLIGHTVLEVLPETESFWIERYGRVALEGTSDKFEGYNAPLGRYYEVRAFCPEVGKFAVMFHDITERKQAEAALVQERQRLTNVIEGTNAGIWEWNVQTGESVFNERWAEIIGYRLEELLPLSIETWTRLTHPEDLKRANELLDKHFSGENDYYECEIRMRHKNGNWVWVLDRGKVATWTEDGKPLLAYGTHQEVTERKQSEQNLKRLLREKDILLAEVHHRVKNNMQIITSLLGLQAQETEDEIVLAAFEESRQRIYSMALVHEQLYRAGEYTHIDFGDYVDQLASTLFNAYQIDSKRVELQIEANNEFLNLERALPCGLLLNELITNSLKYAFPDNRKGKLWISLKRDFEKMILKYSDDGIGIPENFNLETTHSLGLQLVNMLALHDLRGSILLEHKNGTHFHIEFPL